MGCVCVWEPGPARVVSSVLSPPPRPPIHHHYYRHRHEQHPRHAGRPLPAGAAPRQDRDPPGPGSLLHQAVGSQLQGV